MPGKKAPENETPAERFRRVVNNKLASVGGTLDSIAAQNHDGNEYTAAQVDKLCAYLASKIENIKTRLKEPRGGKSSRNASADIV